MAFIDQARKIVREQSRSADRHFAAQNTANAKRSADPSVEEMKNYKTPAVVNGVTCVAATPVLAEQVSAAQLNVRITPSDHAPLTICPPTIPQSGAPCRLSATEYRRLKPEDQARVRAQCLAFEGAVERIKSSRTTLTNAFYTELEYQEKIARSNNKLSKRGTSDVILKAAVKRDKKGYRKMHDAGVASFKGLPTRVESMPDGTFILVQDKVPNDPIQGYTIVRKLKANELTMIKLLQGK